MATSPNTSQQPTARVGWNNRVQTVSIPVSFRFPESVREVFIRRDGESIVLTPRPEDWSAFFASSQRASPDFLVDRERLPVQERGD